jgi:hypothetical protein
MAAAVSMAAERPSISGKVTDAEGKPVEHATVMVYYAGVKQGYSTFCPSCYADCGKRTLTDASGAFTISKLAPDLWFTILVADDGYTPVFVAKIDPALGKTASAVLRTRAKVDDPARVVRGRVVDAHGRPVRDAIVEPRGVGVLRDGKPAGAMFGTIRGLDPLAVTTAQGEFELTYGGPTNKMFFAIEARGMAPKAFLDVATGLERQTFRLGDGATVHGRVVQDGTPVVGAEVGLISQQRPNGAGYDEIRLGTQEDGSFTFTNVPAGEKYYVYPKMESIKQRGAAHYLEAQTQDDGQNVEVGDIKLQLGYRLRGAITLTDGQPVPAGTRVFIGPGCAICKAEDGGFGYFSLKDSQTVIAGPSGEFEFVGLAEGPYQVVASVKGYMLGEGYSIIHPEGIDEAYWRRVSESQNLQQKQLGIVETMVKGNADDLKIVLQPRSAR